MGRPSERCGLMLCPRVVGPVLSCSSPSSPSQLQVRAGDIGSCHRRDLG